MKGSKLKDLSMEQLKSAIKRNREKIEREFRWGWKDKRRKALMNEFERRIMNRELD